MLSINWRRGLFRLWIAASFVWLVGAGALLQGEMRRDVETLMTAALQPPPAFLGAPWEKYELIVFASGVLLLPPLFAFALGWAGLWIVKGFRS